MASLGNSPFAVSASPPSGTVSANSQLSNENFESNGHSTAEHVCGMKDIIELEEIARKIEQASSEADQIGSSSSSRLMETAQLDESIALEEQTPLPQGNGESDIDKANGNTGRRSRFRALAEQVMDFEVEYKPRHLDTQAVVGTKTALGTSSPLLSRNKEPQPAKRLSTAMPVAVDSVQSAAKFEGTEPIDEKFPPPTEASDSIQPSEPPAPEHTPVESCGIESFFRKRSPVAVNEETKSAEPLKPFRVQFSDQVAIIDSYDTLNISAEVEKPVLKRQEELEKAKPNGTSGRSGQRTDALRPGHVAMLAKHFEAQWKDCAAPAPKPVAPVPEKTWEAKKLESAVYGGSLPKRSLESEEPKIPMDKVKRLRMKWRQADEAGEAFEPDLSSCVSDIASAESHEATSRMTTIQETDLTVSDGDTELPLPPVCSKPQRNIRSDDVGESTLNDLDDNLESDPIENNTDIPEDVFLPDDMVNDTDESLDYSEVSSVVLTGGEETPCDRNAPGDASKLRSVSSYRTHMKSYLAGQTPHRLVYKVPMSEERPNANVRSTPSINSRFVHRLNELKEGERIQLEQIHQSSRALNLCFSMFDHRGSPEEIDAQKALLLATERRRCITAEIDRLTQCVRQRRNFEPEEPMGTLTISHISLPLRMNFIRDAISGQAKIVYYFICLLKHREQVFSTQLMSTEDVQTGFLEFSNYFQISPLAPDFELKFELYCLTSEKREAAKATEKKGTFTLNLKRSKMSSIVSRGGPGAILDTTFKLVGNAKICLVNAQRNRFNLENMNMLAPVEGLFLMRSRCCPHSVLALKETGFLNVCSNSGMWNLYWCVLQNGTLEFWRFPEDVATKESLFVIDLHLCVNASQASEEIATRPRTLMLELFDPDSDAGQARSELISADTEEEYNRWQDCIKQVLNFNQVWGSTTQAHRTTESTAV